MILNADARKAKLDAQKEGRAIYWDGDKMRSVLTDEISIQVRGLLEYNYHTVTVGVHSHRVYEDPTQERLDEANRHPFNKVWVWKEYPKLSQNRLSLAMPFDKTRNLVFRVQRIDKNRQRLFGGCQWEITWYNEPDQHGLMTVADHKYLHDDEVKPYYHGLAWKRTF